MKGCEVIEYYLHEDRDKNKRSNAWQFVVYPDSLPAGWLELLQQLEIPCCVSPLHDKDLKFGEDGLPTGDFDKPHYHVNIVFQTLKSMSQVQDLIEPFNGYRYPKIIHSIGGATRYLIHYNLENKVPYDKKDVKCFNGYDFDRYFDLPSDYDVQLDALLDFAFTNNMHKFSSLYMWCRKNAPEWASIMRKNSFFIREFLKDIKYQLKDYGEVENYEN